MILFSVSRWLEGRELVLVPEVLLGVGVATVEAGVAAVAAESFVRADLIYAQCLVAAAARWFRAALLVEDAAASASNWPSSSSSSPGVSPPWPFAEMTGIILWRRCAAAAVPNMSGTSPAAAVLLARDS